MKKVEMELESFIYRIIINLVLWLRFWKGPSLWHMLHVLVTYVIIAVSSLECNLIVILFALLRVVFNTLHTKFCFDFFFSATSTSV